MPQWARAAATTGAPDFVNLCTRPHLQIVSCELATVRADFPFWLSLNSGSQRRWCTPHVGPVHLCYFAYLCNSVGLHCSSGRLVCEPCCKLNGSRICGCSPFVGQFFSVDNKNLKSCKKCTDHIDATQMPDVGVRRRRQVNMVVGDHCP